MIYLSAARTNNPHDVKQSFKTFRITRYRSPFMHDESVS